MVIRDQIQQIRGFCSAIGMAGHTLMTSRKSFSPLLSASAAFIPFCFPLIKMASPSLYVLKSTDMECLMADHQCIHRFYGFVKETLIKSSDPFENTEPVSPFIQDESASEDNERVSHYSPSGTHLPPLTSRTARSIFGSRFSSNANLPVAPSKSLILARVSRNFLRSVVVPDCSTA